MSNRIAVCYCGGCNPRYDRVGAVRALAGQFPGLTFPLPDDPPYDGYLVVCGCTAGCTLRRTPDTSFPVRHTGRGGAGVCPTLAARP